MARLRGAAALAGYRLLGYGLTPFAPLLLGYRARRGKEIPARLGERYGRASRPRPEGRLVWVHAASVGETNAVLPLIERIVAAGVSVVLTSVTVTAAAVAAERLPAGAIHQFSPLDAAPFVRAFVRHWRPQCAIFVESEIWPETVARLSAEGVPQVIVNGRLSERSFAGWKRHAAVAEALFSKISLCLAQSARDARHYRGLGVPEVTVTGNLKFDAPPPRADPEKLESLRAALSGRPAWIAASTHPGEDEIVADAHRRLAERRPGVLTVIAPRHPERGPAIAAMLRERGLATALRSAGEPLGPDTAVYVADTLGELGLFYRLAPTAFMGGSLVPHGGQNPIEPLRVGAAVLHGPHVHNFADVYETIDGCTPDSLVLDAAGLADGVGSLIADGPARKAKAGKALEAFGPLTGALAATLSALEPYLVGRAGSPRGRAAAALPA